MMRRSIAGVFGMMLVSCGSSRCSLRQRAASEPTPPATAKPDAPSGARGADDEGAGARPTEGALDARLEVLRRGGRRSVAYAAPTADEERAYRAWFALALAKLDADLPPPPPPDGFVVEVIDGLWVLGEAAGRARGAGAVALRPRPAVEVLVEAPHTFFDIGTLPIARVAFERSRARALLVNTVHRYRAQAPASGGDDEESSSASDVAHAERSFFLFAHEELTRALPRASAVQFHGFAAAKAPGVAAIVSASTTSGPAAQVAAAMRAVAGAPSAVRLFPDEVRILGGTTNVEAAASRRAGRAFVHVELASDAREQLQRDRALLERTVAAIVAAAATRP